MKMGVVLPNSDLGATAAALRAYAEEVERLGFGHITAFDHVVGADPAVHAGWNAPYDVRTVVQEPLVTFGFLAAVTRLELATGVLVLPQRQTALVAKQAAQVDLLAEGRFRLGVGVGWNPVEFEALGQEFAVRGRRIEEQIGLLRRLWTEFSVTHEGGFDRVHGAGLAPLPMQRPIPIWLGGRSAAVLDRVGRLADGWFPLFPPGAELKAAAGSVAAAAEKAGRDPATVGMEGRVQWRGNLARLVDDVRRWENVGATHLSVNTLGPAPRPLSQHLEILGLLAAELRLPPVKPAHPRPRR